MALGGFGGELVGAAAGTVFGLAVVSENRTCALSDGGCPDKVAPWLVAGQSVGGAFAIHLVNHKRGNLLLTMLTNVGIAGAGWLLVRNGSSSSQLTMMGVAVPIGQLIGGVLVERATESQGN
jgi:hypothetical protein